MVPDFAVVAPYSRQRAFHGLGFLFWNSIKSLEVLVLVASNVVGCTVTNWRQIKQHGDRFGSTGFYLFWHFFVDHFTSCWIVGQAASGGSASRGTWWAPAPWTKPAMKSAGVACWMESIRMFCRGFIVLEGLVYSSMDAKFMLRSHHFGCDHPAVDFGLADWQEALSHACIFSGLDVNDVIKTFWLQTITTCSSSLCLAVLLLSIALNASIIASLYISELSRYYWDILRHCICVIWIQFDLMFVYVCMHSYLHR